MREPSQLRADRAIHFSPREVILVLTNVLSKLGPLTTRVGGCVGFTVTGEGGGRWVVDLDASGGQWLPTEKAAVALVDVEVHATRESFPAVLVGNARVLHQPAPVVEGDRDKLVRLGRLLKEGGSLVASRVRRRFRDDSSNS